MHHLVNCNVMVMYSQSHMKLDVSNGRMLIVFDFDRQKLHLFHVLEAGGVVQILEMALIPELDTKTFSTGNESGQARLLRPEH